MSIGNAIIQMIQATTEHDKAYAEYEGREWGYHGHHLTQAMHKAEERLELELAEFIAAIMKGERHES